MTPGSEQPPPLLCGGSCDRVQYDPNNYDAMAKKLAEYDGYIVRINPGQLSNPGVVLGAQAKFDGLMSSFVKAGKPVWSSPAVQTQMGAKVGGGCTSCVWNSLNLLEKTAHYNTS